MIAVGVFSKRFEHSLSDGLVSEDSSKFGEYKGNCLDESTSHTPIVDLVITRKKRQKVFDVYLELCNDLSERGM